MDIYKDLQKQFQKVKQSVRNYKACRTKSTRRKMLQALSHPYWEHGTLNDHICDLRLEAINKSYRVKGCSSFTEEHLKDVEDWVNILIANEYPINTELIACHTVVGNKPRIGDEVCVHNSRFPWDTVSQETRPTDVCYLVYGVKTHTIRNGGKYFDENEKYFTYHYYEVIGYYDSTVEGCAGDEPETIMESPSW